MQAHLQSPQRLNRWSGSNASRYLLLGFLACCMLVLMVIVYQSADRASSVESPLVDATMEIRLEVTTGYLLLQEILSGEIASSYAPVREHFDQADWYARAMLDGGANVEGAFRPLENSELREAVEACRVQLAEFAEFSWIRYQGLLDSPAGDPTNTFHHQLFQELVNSVDHVETALQQSIESELWSFRVSQLAMLLTILLLAIFAGRIFLHLERRKKLYLAELEAARSDLEIRVEERTATLRVLNQQLTQEVKERHAAEAALSESEAALRQLLAAVMEAQDQERERIASKLSEGIGQSIAAATLALGAIMRKSGPQEGYEFRTALDFIQTALRDLRCLGDDLHPEILDRFGILETTRWFCQRFEKAYPGMRIVFHCDLSEEEIPRQLRVPIYRILQEALNQTASQHAAASVEVRLTRERPGLQLTISDQGPGTGPILRATRLDDVSQIGMRSMQERVKHSGGHLKVESPPGKRRQVSVTWGQKKTSAPVALQTVKVDPSLAN